MRRQRSLLVLPALLLFTSMAFAQSTKLWTQNTFEDFEKGTSKGVAISSDGSLTVAPAFKSIYTSPSTYIWSMVADSDGNAYLASGSPARIYRVTPDGKASIVFEAKELQVQALEIDPATGTLYAGTAPDGKVFKIQRTGTAAPAKSQAKSATEAKSASADEKNSASVPVDDSYKSSVFFDPKSKYIWALALDPSTGRLYVATGDQGQIYKVEKDGTGSVFFDSDEAHIRSLALLTSPAAKSGSKADGSTLIAGSDGSGLVYRITPDGQAFVLYSAPKKEITALTTDEAGNIYAAAVGEKRGGPSPIITLQNQANPNPNAPPPAITAPVTAGGSDVYEIASDGAPRRLWTSKDDVAYALEFDSAGRLLIGTGNRGKIYAIEKNAHAGSFVDLLKASANQVTSFARTKNGVLAAASNLGKLFLIGDSPESEASYESDVFDAGTFSKWGRAEVRGSGPFDFFMRSGNVDNPDRNWSQWSAVDLRKSGMATVPPARFLQWKAVLHAAKQPATIERVGINYRSRNVAPVVEAIAVQVGARFNSSPLLKPSSETIMIPLGVGNSSSAPTSSPAAPAIPIAATRDPGSIAVRWAAVDDNDDDLVYSVYYKGDNETEWKLLKSGIEEKQYSWDAGLLPDGGYQVKVVASDAPSHSPEDALSDEKISDRFEVDTTPPRVEALQAAPEGDSLHITFRAVDSFSPIKRAEYSVDASDWHFVEPIGELSDNLAENYDFNVPLKNDANAPSQTSSPANATASKTKRGNSSAAASANAYGEHVVVVRVWDRYDNEVSAKTVTGAKR